MNKQDIIDTAMQIATGMGGDGHNSPVIDSEMTAEDLLPIVFRHVYIQILRDDPNRFQDLLEAHDIIVSDGVGPLPDRIMTEYMHLAFLPDYPYSSKAMFHDFRRQKFTNMLCYWTWNNAEFFTTCSMAGSEEVSDEGSGSTEGETIVLHAVSVPELPVSMTEEVDISERDLNAVVYALALAIRGDLKLTT